MKKLIQTQIPYEMYREFRIACATEGVSMTQKVDKLIQQTISTRGRLAREARQHLQRALDKLSDPQPRQNVTFVVSQTSAAKLSKAERVDNYKRTTIISGIISHYLELNEKQNVPNA